jgi:hypothetical protein
VKAVYLPALHTLWQSFVAAILTWWAASGVIDVKAVHNIDDAKRFGLSVLMAVLAALGSAILHTVKLYYKQGLIAFAKGENVSPALLADMDAILARAPEAGTKTPHPFPAPPTS